MPIVAAGITAGASLLGGLMGSSSAKKAAKYELQGKREQIAAAERNRDYQYDLNAPAISTGQNASDLYAGFLGVGTDPVTDWEAYVRGNPDAAANWASIKGTSSDIFGGDIAAFGKNHYEKDGSQRDLSAFTSSGQPAGAQSGAALDAFRGSTGYKDLVKEGLSAVNASAYARGASDSGATLKALQDRGTSLADRSAQGWLGNLGNLISQGSQARGLVAGVGTSTVGAVNGATQSGADASANASLINGQNWATTLQNIGNSAAYAYGSSYGSPSAPAAGGSYVLPSYAGSRA